MRSWSTVRSPGNRTSLSRRQGRRRPPSICCNRLIGWPVNRHTSSARRIRCRSPERIRSAADGSIRANCACIAGQPTRPAWASSCARTPGSAAGRLPRPRSRARKYRPVPPTTSGMRPAAVIRVMAASASSRKSPAENGCCGSRTSISAWGNRASVAASGLALPISRRRYTCAESALTRPRGKCPASAMARPVLPDAVGPMTKIAAGRRSRPQPGTGSCPAGFMTKAFP